MSYIKNNNHLDYTTGMKILFAIAKTLLKYLGKKVNKKSVKFEWLYKVKF